METPTRSLPGMWMTAALLPLTYPAGFTSSQQKGDQSPLINHQCTLLVVYKPNVKLADLEEDRPNTSLAFQGKFPRAMISISTIYCHLSQNNQMSEVEGSWGQTSCPIWFRCSSHQYTTSLFRKRMTGPRQSDLADTKI